MGQRGSPRGGVATVDSAANNADDAAPPTTTTCCQDPCHQSWRPTVARGMTMMHPPHCYWQGSFKIFAFGLMDPSLLPSLWSGSMGDMNRHVPRGGADGDGKRLGIDCGIVNLQEPGRLPSPIKINSFLCPSFRPSVRAKRGIWSKRLFIRKMGNFSFSMH
jgi:hypothetical protein